MKIRIPLLLLAALLLSLSACRKDSELISIEKKTSPFVVSIQTQITGFVQDSVGAPLANALVTFGNKSTSTDEFGFFAITNFTNEKSALIQVEKEGYFTAHQNLVPNKPGAVRTVVQLAARDVIGRISATDGGTVDVTGKMSVDFAENSFVDASGTPYQGEVNVYATYIDPTLPNIEAIMPGNLQAIDSENQEQLLMSFGMVNVELEGESGQKLQLSQAAELGIVVPSALIDQAPGLIPLWHFDTNEGMWREEGSAVLQGNKYVGAVSHFSFWNVDVPGDFSFIRGKVEFNKYEVFVKVRVTDLSTNVMNVSHLNADGSFAGAVPSNNPLLLEVISECGTVLHSQDLGVLSSDSNLGTIALELEDTEVSVVAGVVVNCDNLPVSNGFVIIEQSGYGYRNLSLNAQGGFEASIFNCSSSPFKVFAVDIDNQVRGNAVEVALGAFVNLGTLTACGEQIANGLKFDFNGTSILLPNASVRMDNAGITEFTVLDGNDVDGKVVYQIQFIDWFQGQGEEQQWVMSFSQEIFDQPARLFEVFANDGTVIVEDIGGRAPGEVVSMRIPSATVKDSVTGEEDVDTEVIVTAILQ